MELTVINNRVEKIKELNNDLKNIETLDLEIRNDQNLHELIKKEYSYNENDLARVVVNDKAIINEAFNKYLRPATDLKKKVYEWYKIASENEKLIKDSKDKCLKSQESARIKAQRELQDRLDKELKESQKVIEREEYTLDDNGELVTEITKEIDLSLQIAKQEEIDKQLKQVKIIQEKITKDMIEIEPFIDLYQEQLFIANNDLHKLIQLGILRVNLDKVKSYMVNCIKEDKNIELKGLKWSKRG